jgi:organic radical activating enzyme
MAFLGYLQVTRECNQRCRFCSNPPSGRADPLPVLCAALDDLQARGCAGVILTGGEPTLHPDLPALVAQATARGLPCRIITNGQLLAEGPLLDALVDAGLRHLHLSRYTHRDDLADAITGTPGSGARAERALARIGRHPAGITVDVNVVICRQNADHLDGLARHLTARHPYVRHVVWNLLDPTADRVAASPDTVPRLADVEISLHRALHHLLALGRTFRVERVPLCRIAELAWAVTETRKLVKDEARVIRFLDDKGLVSQVGPGAWQRGKTAACAVCTLEPICAGLDSLDVHYAGSELYPVFLDPEPIRRRILSEA